MGPAAKKPRQPRDVLATNIKKLIDHHKMSAPRIAARAKIDRKTVNNMLNARFGTSVDSVDAVAGAFGLRAWQLMRDELVADVAHAAAIEELIERFSNATPEQRAIIMSVTTELARPRKP